MRVALFPAPPSEPDAYLSLLRDALDDVGVECVDTQGLTPGWASRLKGEIDLVHLHWLEYIAPSDPTPFLGQPKTLRRSLRVLSTLKTLRTKDIGIVWTVHNAAPHEPLHPQIEHRTAAAVFALADQTIVHSNYARGVVCRNFARPSKVQVIPHGSYVGVYPQCDQSRRELRSRHDLPEDAFVYLSFGQIRRYKRLPEVIRAFSSLPGDDLALLIVGEPRDADEARRVCAAAEWDSRIHLDLRRVPVEQVVAVHAECDAAVFGYEMFSSGSALLAVSCGLPIAAPARSAAAEIADPPALAPFFPGGLAAALHVMRNGDPQRQRHAALAAADRHDWRTIGRQTADVYRLALDPDYRVPAAEL